MFQSQNDQLGLSVRGATCGVNGTLVVSLNVPRFFSLVKGQSCYA